MEKRQVDLEENQVKEGLELMRLRDHAVQTYQDWLDARFAAYHIDADACETLTYNPVTGRLLAVLKPRSKEDAVSPVGNTPPAEQPKETAAAA